MVGSISSGSTAPQYLVLHSGHGVAGKVVVGDDGLEPPTFSV
jgi:hypothetical protein